MKGKKLDFYAYEVEVRVEELTVPTELVGLILNFENPVKLLVN